MSHFTMPISLFSSLVLTVEMVESTACSVIGSRMDPDWLLQLTAVRCCCYSY